MYRPDDGGMHVNLSNIFQISAHIRYKYLGISRENLAKNGI